MREIKFRGKRVDNGEWVYGLPVNYCNETYILVLTDFEEERVYEQYPHKEMWPYEIIPETVGQYTGLKDKNGKEIYDIDICESLDGRFLIVWNEEKAAFEMMFQDGERLCLEEMWDDTEVIGNLHDNLYLWEVV